MTSYMPGFAPQQPGIGGMTAGLGGGMAQLIRSMMMQRPDLAQILASMSQQKAGGLGQLAGGAAGQMGGNLAARVPQGGMPSTGGPMPYSGPMPQGGMWGRPMQPMAPQGGNGYNMGAGGVRPGFGQGMPGNTGSGPTMPYQQRFNQTPQSYTPPMPMPTANRPAFTAQPQTPPSPGAFSSQPMAGNGGTVGLDWYAQQAGA